MGARILKSRTPMSFPQHGLSRVNSRPGLGQFSRPGHVRHLVVAQLSLGSDWSGAGVGLWAGVPRYGPCQGNLAPPPRTTPPRLLPGHHPQRRCRCPPCRGPSLRSEVQTRPSRLPLIWPKEPSDGRASSGRRLLGIADDRDTQPVTEALESHLATSDLGARSSPTGLGPLSPPTLMLAPPVCSTTGSEGSAQMSSSLAGGRVVVRASTASPKR